MRCAAEARTSPSRRRGGADRPRLLRRNREKSDGGGRGSRGSRQGRVAGGAAGGVLRLDGGGGKELARSGSARRHRARLRRRRRNRRLQPDRHLGEGRRPRPQPHQRRRAYPARRRQYGSGARLYVARKTGGGGQIDRRDAVSGADAAARMAKEAMFEDDALAEFPIAVPSRGSSLFWPKPCRRNSTGQRSSRSSSTAFSPRPRSRICRRKRGGQACRNSACLTRAIRSSASTSPVFSPAASRTCRRARRCARWSAPRPARSLFSRRPPCCSTAASSRPRRSGGASSIC